MLTGKSAPFSTLLAALACVAYADLSMRLDEREELGHAFSLPRFVTELTQSYDRGPCLPPTGDLASKTLDISGAGLTGGSGTRVLKASSLSLYGETCGGNGGAGLWRLPLKASPMDDAIKLFSVSVLAILEGTEGLAAAVRWVFGEGGPIVNTRGNGTRVPPVWCGKSRGIRRFVLVRPNKDIGGVGKSPNLLRNGGLYIILDVVDKSGNAFICSFGEGPDAVRAREEAAKSRDSESAGQNSREGGGLSGGVIAGIAAGAMMLLVLAGVCIVFSILRRRRQSARGGSKAYRPPQRKDPGAGSFPTSRDASDFSVPRSGSYAASSDITPVEVSPKASEFRPIVLYDDRERNGDEE